MYAPADVIDAVSPLESDNVIVAVVEVGTVVIAEMGVLPAITARISFPQVAAL